MKMLQLGWRVCCMGQGTPEADVLHVFQCGCSARMSPAACMHQGFQSVIQQLHMLLAARWQRAKKNYMLNLNIYNLLTSGLPSPLQGRPV
jgi:hypothetical protein